VLLLSSVFLRLVFVCIDINNLQIILCFTLCVRFDELYVCSGSLPYCHVSFWNLCRIVAVNKSFYSHI